MPANIFVGDYEARATPIADTNPATAGPNLDNAVPIIPTMAYVQGDQANRHKAYNFVANAPGYGHVRFKVTGLKPGETRNVTLEFPTNYASQSKGAVATGEGDDHNLLIDDTEGTNWDFSGAPVQGRQVVVKLSGPVTFTTVNVSAMTTGFPTMPRGPGTPTEPAENRFTALRAFDLYSCTADADPANPTCDGATEAGWQRILKSQDDAFPAVRTRDRRSPTWRCGPGTSQHDRDACPARRPGQPVHGSGVVPGRPGQRPGQQLRLPGGQRGRRAASSPHRGARGGAAGPVLQPDRARRRREQVGIAR